MAYSVERVAAEFPEEAMYGPGPSGGDDYYMDFRRVSGEALREPVAVMLCGSMGRIASGTVRLLPNAPITDPSRETTSGMRLDVHFEPPVQLKPDNNVTDRLDRVAVVVIDSAIAARDAMMTALTDHHFHDTSELSAITKINGSEI